MKIVRCTIMTTPSTENLHQLWTIHRTLSTDETINIQDFSESDPIINIARDNLQILDGERIILFDQVDTLLFLLYSKTKLNLDSLNKDFYDGVLGSPHPDVSSFELQSPSEVNVRFRKLIKVLLSISY